MVFGQVSMEAEDVWGMGNEQCLVGGKVRCAFGLESCGTIDIKVVTD